VDDVELNLLKTANVSGYLLNVERICGTISTARSCIAGCGVDSNPFALESTTAICSPESLAEIATITPCLEEQGNEIANTCTQECGNYEQISGEVQQLTNSMRPEANEPQKLAQVMGKINDACGMLKCSDRCTSKTMAEQCPALANGKNAGSVIKSIIERVLVAQRRDLERMKLVDAMAQAVPTQCNYMYVPETMFNVTRDELAMAVINEMHRSEQVQKQAQKLSGESQAKELSDALVQLQANLLQRQMQVMEVQERNAIKESRKLDLELQLLQRKRLQAASFEEGPIKQF